MMNKKNLTNLTVKVIENESMLPKWKKKMKV